MTHAVVHQKKFTISPFMRKLLLTKIVESYLLVAKKVLYKFPNDIAPQLLTLSLTCKNLRFPPIFLISEVNSCPILMFEYSFQSLEPPLQESELILPLGGLQVSKKCWCWWFLAHFCRFWVPYRPPSGKITSYSCRGGHKLQNEWSNIKIGQVLTSEISKEW